MIPPVNPFQRLEFDLGYGGPGPAGVDEFGFVKAIDGLGQRIVIGLTGNLRVTQPMG